MNRYKENRSLGDLASKTYLFSYPYPNGKKKAELDKLFNIEKHHITRCIKNKKLIEKNFIEYYQLGNKPKDPYYIKVKIDPIIEKIEEIAAEKKYDIDKFDLDVLELILKSNAFRQIIKSSNNVNKIYHDPINTILFHLDVLFITSEKFKDILDWFKEDLKIPIRTNFRNIIQYSSYLREIEPIMKAAAPVFKNVFNIDSNLKNVAATEDLVLLFIPDRQRKRMKFGFTDFSDLYFTFDKLICGIEKRKKKIRHTLKNDLGKITKATIENLKK